jgi:hypothetical protein
MKSRLHRAGSIESRSLYAMVQNLRLIFVKFLADGKA